MLIIARTTGVQRVVMNSNNNICVPRRNDSWFAASTYSLPGWACGVRSVYRRHDSDRPAHPVPHRRPVFRPLEPDARVHRLQRRGRPPSCSGREEFVGRRKRRDGARCVQRSTVLSLLRRPSADRLQVNSGFNWGEGVGRPPQKVKKDFCHSGESVLDVTCIRRMCDSYLK